MHNLRIRRLTILQAVTDFWIFRNYSPALKGAQVLTDIYVARQRDAFRAAQPVVTFLGLRLCGFVDS